MKPDFTPKNTGLMFKADMILAYLEGRKNQTRRVKGLQLVNESPDDWQLIFKPAHEGVRFVSFGHKSTQQAVHLNMPYGGINDTLYFKETYKMWAGPELRKLFILLMVAVLFLTACTSSAPALPNEMIVSMTSYSDVDMDIVQLCVDQPKGLYWHEQAQMWAVICEMEYEDMYGAVLMDISYTVISTDHVNAKSVSDLQKMVFSVGWQER